MRLITEKVENIKKAFVLFLAILLTVTWWGGSATEEEQTEYKSGDYSYILLEDGTAEITRYRGGASSLSIPNNLEGYTVTSIGDSAFAVEMMLETVTIPNIVTSIGEGVFSRCESLASVMIGIGVEHIGDNPFFDCKALTKIVVSPDHPFLATIDNVLFHKQDKRLISYPGSLSGVSYTVPDGTLSIGVGAFYRCDDSLSSVSIPDSVTSIGNSAFSGCMSLSSVTIPDSVTSIGIGAFLGCDELTLAVGRDSYAMGYAIMNEISYTFKNN